jgi:hypothetical protein
MSRAITVRLAMLAYTLITRLSSEWWPYVAVPYFLSLLICEHGLSTP